eukprot:SM003851S14682  [mRNA]  locus=s3851:1161:1328:+ [translate_table: standard]
MVAAAEIDCHSAQQAGDKFCLVAMVKCLHAYKHSSKQRSRGFALTWALHPQLSTCE